MPDGRSPGSRRSDPGSGFDLAPGWLNAVWTVLICLALLEAGRELSVVGGSSVVYETWFPDVVLAITAVLILGRAARLSQTRDAWLAIGLAMASWCVGSIAWSVAYHGEPNAPYPSFADIFWLLWYPLMMVGILCLIRVRIPHFELHRWMDGLAVALIVLAAGFAILVEPVATNGSQSIPATIVDFSYPTLDVLLVGAILGIVGLLGWRPDRMWVLIGAGILTMTIADGAFAYQHARGVADQNQYGFLWTFGALLIGYAAWVEAPALPMRNAPVTGLRAIALPLLAQALAAGIQIYALFFELGKSERVVTLAVLVVSSVQIILTRPRAEPAIDTPHEPT